MVFQEGSSEGQYPNGGTVKWGKYLFDLPAEFVSLLIYKDICILSFDVCLLIMVCVKAS